MEKLDSLFSDQAAPQMARATTRKLNFIAAMSDSGDKSCVECNEPIFMVKTHDSVGKT
jgi:hypothetical protein